MINLAPISICSPCSKRIELSKFRILQLISALRASGVRVSLAESSEAFSAVDLMGIQDREHFRLSLRSTLIKDVRDLPVFDKLFPLFFGTGQPPMMGGSPTDNLTPEEIQQLVDALKQFSEQLCQRMERLMNGEPLSRGARRICPPRAPLRCPTV